MPQNRKRTLIPRGRAPYRRGAALERRVKAKLEQSGWTVFRVAGSRGAVDLVAVRDGPQVGKYWEVRPRIVYVQVKRNSDITVGELGGLRVEAKKVGAEAVVVDGKYRVRAVDRWDEGWEGWGDVF